MKLKKTKTFYLLVFLTVVPPWQQRKRVGSQKWVSPEEDATEGDLGLAKIAQLDICTGTAVCFRDGDNTSDSMDSQEGAEDKSE